MYDRMSRSALKIISWRMIASITTMFLVYIITGRFVLTLSVGVFDVVIKMMLYFIHERAWDKIEFGKKINYLKK
ncbi:MAG: DUF2061 domain-containing protein [Candidatus Hodarchaeota archaeon]